MILKDTTISYTPNNESKHISMQEMYDLLIDKDINTNGEELNEEVIGYIIAWLPNITAMCVTRTFNNNWLDIAFTNNQVMRFYNIGIEYAISCWVERLAED